VATIVTTIFFIHKNYITLHKRLPKKMENNTLKALQLCPLFEKTGTDEIQRTMEGINYRYSRLGKKEPYTIHHDVDIIIQGEMAVRMTGPSGKSMQVMTKSIGAIIAPACVFTSDSYIPVTYEVTKPTILLRMNQATLQEMLNSNERLRMNFVILLSNSCNYLARKVRMLTLHTVREKVAVFLLQESTYNRNTSFFLTKSRQEIADSFAIQKFSLQRCLREFADEGIIILEGKHITILNPQKLQSFTDDNLISSKSEK